MQALKDKTMVLPIEEKVNNAGYAVWDKKYLEEDVSKEENDKELNRARNRAIIETNKQLFEDL